MEIIKDKNKAKEFVSQKIKDALITNNMARVTALAKDAALKGESVPGEERVGYEDFYSDYALKLVELSRTWNPAINPNLALI